MPAVESTKHLIELMDARRVEKGMSYTQTMKASGQSSQNLGQAVKRGDTTIVFRQILELVEALDAELVFQPKPRRKKADVRLDQLRKEKALKEAEAAQEVQVEEVATGVLSEPPAATWDPLDPEDPVTKKVNEGLDAIYEMTSGWANPAKAAKK